jgi:hypothetical protein
MTTNVDLKGNTLQVEDVEIAGGTKVSDIVSLHTPTFDTAVADPGTDATTIGFDKVLKITVGSTDYYVGLIDNNTSA